MGINVNQTISLTFLLGGMLAGAAGLVYALYETNIVVLPGLRGRPVSRSPPPSWAASATSAAPCSAA